MIEPSTLSSRVVKASNTALAPNFTPGKYDVVCSRGRRAYNLVGNQHFRRLIDAHLKVYTQACTRAEKSVLIIAIVDIIRRQSPRGGFVKLCKKTNTYFEIGDTRAKEKVGHAFREALSSSTKGGWKSCQITAGSHGTEEVRSACSDSSLKESKEATQKTSVFSSTDEKSGEQLCDEPLPAVAAPAQMQSEVRSACLTLKESEEATQKISSTGEKNGEQFCDKPLQVATSPHQMPLLATFAAEFNFDRMEEATCSSTDMDSREVRLLAELDDLSSMGTLFEAQDWFLFESVW